MNYYRRYLVLTVLGALIIGVAFYLFLNNYLDRQEILVAAKDISEGEKIEEEDLCFKEYYKNSLPEHYLESKEKVIGKIINIDRKKDDYISMDMFSEDTSKNIFESLAEGEVLIAINVGYLEPLLEELRVGRCISIVSTEKDRELLDACYFGFGEDEIYTKDDNAYKDISILDVSETEEKIADEISDKNKNVQENKDYFNSSKMADNNGYLDNNSYKLSKNVILIDGQLIVRNLEIVSIRKYINSSKSILINKNESSVSIYIKCDMKQAPLVARLTKDNNYKIIFENL